MAGIVDQRGFCQFQRAQGREGNERFREALQSFRGSPYFCWEQSRSRDIGQGVRLEGQRVKVPVNRRLEEEVTQFENVTQICVG